jgi:predicted DNA-binding transcriptional regulator YafY
MSDNTNPEQLALPPGVDRVSDLGTLLTLREASERLGVSVKTVRRMVTRGDLPGSHQVPMTSGKGMQWVVPYSEIVRQENTVKAQAPAPSETMTELLALREQVARLEAERNLLRALADERAHSLEQLHTSFRALMPAQADRPKQRRWRKK